MVEYWQAILILIVFVFAIGLALLVLIAIITANRVPYKPIQVITQTERRFLGPLLRSIDLQRYYLFAQVRLSGILQIPKRDFAWNLFNKLGSKSVDFVMVDRETLLPKAVIELDDKTHELTHRIIRDQYVDHILNKAKIPVVHIKVHNSYDVQEISNRIQTAIEDYS